MPLLVDTWIVYVMGALEYILRVRILKTFEPAFIA